MTPAERDRIRDQAQETAARLAKEHGPMPPALADRIGRLLTEAGTSKPHTVTDRVHVMRPMVRSRETRRTA